MLIRGCFALLCCVLASPAWAAVVCGNETSLIGEPPAANPQTMAYTPDAGTNRVVIVSVGLRDTDADNATVSGVTSSAGGTFTSYGSANRAGAGGADLYTNIFYATDFVDGAQTLSITYTSTVLQGIVAAYTCTGVRTSSPFRDVAATATGTATTATVDVTSTVTGDLVIDAMTTGSLDSGINPTVGANQTQMYNLQGGIANVDVVGSTEPGNGTITMSWTTLTGVEGWSIVAGALVPQEAAPAILQSPSPPMILFQ